MSAPGSTGHGAVAMAALDDAERLSSLFAEAVGEGGAGGWTPRGVADVLANDGFGCLIANAEGQIIAGALARIAADEAELLNLVVLKTGRRQGWARQLLVAAISAARRLGAQKLLLEVACDNNAALNLYKTSGFASVGMRPAYYKRGALMIDAEILQLRIGA